MSSWHLKLLLAVFATHGLIFLGLAVKRRSCLHGLLALTFGLLITATLVRLFWAEATLFGLSLHACLRVAAWAMTALAIVLFLRRRSRERHGP